MPIPTTPAASFAARRRALLARHEGPALIASGLPRSRNFPANRYPFRATSHFLYFVGASIPGAALLFARGEAVLFAPPPEPGDALWHGPRPSLADLARTLDLAAARPIDDLDDALRSLGQVATLPTQDAESAAA